MARTLAIEPRRAINAAKASGGAISLSGALSHVVGAGPPVSIPPVVKNVAGGLTPHGALATLVSGPSVETKSQFVSGAIVPTGAFSDNVVVGPPIGISNLEVGGFLDLTGTVVGVASGPSLVTIQKTLVGFFGISSVLLREAISPPPPAPTTLTQDVDGTLTPAGDVATAVSGPSFVTVTESVAGTITPAGDLTTDTIAPPVTEFFKSVAGSITPSSSLARQVSGPSFVTVPKSVGGTITPGGATTPVIAPTFVVRPQAVAGTVLSSGTVARAVTGPSIETKLKSIAGSITPHGAKTDLVIAPPPTFFSKAVVGTLTPSGSLATLKSGPSFETKTKFVVGQIAPSSIVTRTVTGPSFVIVPKSVAGVITPHGTVTKVVPIDTSVIKKTLTGAITPHGARTATVIGGPPQTANPMYFSMGNWDADELDNAPQWKGVTFSQLPSTVTAVRQMLDAMRSRGIKGGMALTVPGQMGDRRPDGTLDFNMTKYKALVDRLAAVPSLSTYVADKTCELFCFGDELQHPKWNGTIPPDTRKAMARYAKETLPVGMIICVRMPSDRLKGIHLPTNGWEGWLDAGWAQYTGPFRSASVGMTATQFYTSERTAQLALGIPHIILGANWWNGGDGSSGIPGPRDDEAGGENFWVMSDVEIKSAADAAVAISAAKYFMYWTDAVGSGLSGSAEMRTIQASAAYQAAFLYAKNLGLNRGGEVVKNYFTDTGFFSAPHPPPAIALGKGVKDTLTGHKVFRLVDNARAQNAEYPALNADNSVIYYIKGTTGFIADVSWNIAQSSVQVSGERTATGSATPVPEPDGWIWSRTERKYGYFASLTGPARLCRRDIVLNSTVIIKNFGTDTTFSAFWTAAGFPNTILKGLHANRNQEVFAGLVLNNAGTVVAGAVIWNSLNGNMWNYQAIAGKTLTRVVVDDPGLYVTFEYSDGSWQVGRMETNGLLTKTLNQANGPKRFDFGAINGGQQVYQASGLGIQTWDVDPLQLTPGTVYSNPQRNSKQDLYQQGTASLQSSDNIVAFLYYDALIVTPWQVHSGAVYKINWTAEMAARTFKRVPDVVRQGSIHLTRLTP